MISVILSPSTRAFHHPELVSKDDETLLIFIIFVAVVCLTPEILGKKGMTKPKGSGDINTQSTM